MGNGGITFNKELSLKDLLSLVLVILAGLVVIVGLQAHANNTDIHESPDAKQARIEATLDRNLEWRDLVMDTRLSNIEDSIKSLDLSVNKLHREHMKGLLHEVLDEREGR